MSFGMQERAIVWARIPNSRRCDNPAALCVMTLAVGGRDILVTRRMDIICFCKGPLYWRKLSVVTATTYRRR
jgi:hypothetical protein